MAPNCSILPKLLNKTVNLLTIFVIFAPFGALADTYNCDEHQPCLPGIQEMVEQYRKLYRRYGVHDVGLQTAEMSTLKGNYTRGLCQKCGDYFEGQDSYGEQENAPRLVKVYTFKGKNEFQFLADSDAQKYSGVAAITCEVGDDTWTTTAFLVGSFKVAVTTSHTFYRRIKDERGKTVRVVHAKPSDCVFQNTNRNGDVIETINLAKVTSQWDDPKFFGKPELDRAVVTLASESTTATNLLPITYFDGKDTPIDLIGYHGDLPEATIKRISAGHVFAKMPGDPLLNVTGLYPHDAPTLPASSGSPVVSKKTGQVIGINTAGVSIHKDPSIHDFSLYNNYNVFVVFDKDFVAVIKKEAGL